MRPDDFFVRQVETIFGGTFSRDILNENLLSHLRSGPSPDHSDIEVAVALARLVHDEYEKFGTEGHQILTESQSRDAMLTLHVVLKRLGIDDFSPAYRDFSSFKIYWKRKEGTGSYKARRDMLNEAFSDLHEQLAKLEVRSLTSTLAQPITSHAGTGWPRVDAEIAELRRHFQNAQTVQDHRNVGNDCVIITEVLSATVYDSAKHLLEGGKEPPISNTKDRLDRYVEVALVGSNNAELRKLARACIELAQAVKHRKTPSRRDAGIAADAVILLANLLRRVNDN
jgi:hypothetical protein